MRLERYPLLQRRVRRLVEAGVRAVRDGNVSKQFLEWVAKQKVQAEEVVSCSEAGPTGFWLHLPSMRPCRR